MGVGFPAAVDAEPLVGIAANQSSITVRATVRGDADEPAWSEEERPLIQLVDELHDTTDISDKLWKDLATAFSVDQIFELIALVGFYHTVSFFAKQSEASSRA